MKVLLTTLNSKYVHTNPALKCLYLAGESYCHKLDIREFTINNSRDYVFTELVMQDMDAVCFSCYIWNIERTLELASDLKKARPGLRILLGGPEVSYDAAEIMKQHPFLDFILSGEGEEAFPRWCEALAGGIPYEQVPGLSYRQGGEVLVRRQAAPPCLEEQPFAYERFPCEKDKVIYYESSRGCPFRCSYCISSLDRSIRTLSLERVKRDLDRFIREGVKQVKFLDRTFNWDNARTLEIFRYLMQKDAGQTNFHFEICAELLAGETFQLLAEARRGLFQFEIGIQSTNCEALRAVDRSGRVEPVLENVRRLVDLGNSHIHVDLIAGLPFEDYPSFRKSFNDVYALGADNLQLGFLKLLRGTKIRKEASDYGYTYMSRAPYQIISNSFLTATEVCSLKQIETVLDLYHNRGGFETALPQAISLAGGNAFDFFKRLADYYYSGGFQHSSHKKEDLYRIFYKFSRFCGWGDETGRLLERDLERTMNFDAVKKFKRKGWNIL